MYVKPQIIIVDDDINLNKTVSDIFRRQGYEPTVILTGKDALGTVGKKPFDIALLDLKLEDMSGLEVMREIKKDHPDMECIVLTGHSCTESTIEAIRLGAYAYIQKPYGMEQLLTIIRCALEKRKVVDALRISEEKSRAIIESSKDAMVAIDDKGLITIFNPAAESLFGRMAEEMKGCPPDLLMPEEYRKKHRENIKNYFATGKPDGAIGKTVELPVLHSSGRIVPVELTLSAGKIKNRQFALAAIRDITESKKAAEALKESEERYRSIVNTAMDAIITVDSDGRIVFWNSGAERIFCYSKEEVLNTSLGIIIPAGLSENDDIDILHQMISMGKIIGNRLELMGIRKGGEEFPMELSLGNWLSDGKTFFTLIIRDISDRKKLEDSLLKEKLHLEEVQKELLNKHREVEEINRELNHTQMMAIQKEKLASIGQLAAGVAHEINNPIGFISGNLRALKKYISKFTDFIEIQDEFLKSTGSPETLEILKEKRKKLKLDYITEDINELIDESLDGTDRVARIVRDLKSFSRVDEAECKPADVNECIESTLNIVWNEIKYKASVKKEYGDIPHIKCYPQQLNQVFMNLIVNASHAIEKEGVIGIKTWQEGEAVFISVSDTGCGIPEENLKKLFEPFFTTKEVGKGTGLGLSITYDIVKKHEGEIIVESTVGKGTVFTIKLPLVKEEKI